MATDYRSPDRGTAITFRMSRQQRDQLRVEATARGYTTVQRYLEARVFGEAGAIRQPGPQPKNQQELPMTG